MNRNTYFSKLPLYNQARKEVGRLPKLSKKKEGVFFISFPTTTNTPSIIIEYSKNIYL